MKLLQVKKIKSLGIQKTLDFEVDSENHNFYANNIVVSNSHAVGYAYLTAITVYLKANHPKEFFLSLLRAAKHESKPLEEIAKIQQELKHFNIQLLPPDIIKSEIDFSIEGNNIRYGLASIKGISDKTIEKLNRFKHEYSNKFEIFQGWNEAEMDIRVFNSLIKAGALGGYKCTRSRLVLEAAVWNILTDKEKSKCLELGQQHNFDLLKIIVELNKTVKDEKNKPIIKDSRFETIRKKYLPAKEIYLTNKQNEKLSNWYFEHEMLGFAYSTNITNIFKEKIEDGDISSIEEIQAMKGEPYVRLAGRVVEVQTSMSKKNKAYMKVIVKDDSGICTALVFGDKIQEHEDLNAGKVAVNDLVVIRGRKKPDCIFADVIATQKDVVTKIGKSEKPIKEEKLPS